MKQPREWCDPPEAFGRPDAPRRVWLTPTKPSDLPDFRAAVVQHVIASEIRRQLARQDPKITQEQLADADGRPDAANQWNARLNGRRSLTFRDMAFLYTVFEGALLPLESVVFEVLYAAHNHQPLSPDWDGVDR